MFIFWPLKETRSAQVSRLGIHLMLHQGDPRSDIDAEIRQKLLAWLSAEENKTYLLRLFPARMLRFCFITQLLMC